MNQNNTYPSLPQAWVIFAIYVAASIGIGLMILAINGIIDIQNQSIGNFVAYNVSLMFVIWFAWKNKIQQVEKVFHFGPIQGMLYPLLIIITVSFAIFLDPLINLIPLPDIMKEVFALLSKRDVWTFLMVCISGPVLEEVLFRGIILDGFLSRYKPGKAIFWSAFLFGLFHMNPWQFIPGFLIGLLLGYIYMKTRSLIPVILVHVVNNTFSYIIMYIYGDDVFSLRDIFANPGDYVLFFSISTVIAAASLWILYKILNQKSDIWTFNSKTNSS